MCVYLSTYLYFIQSSKWKKKQEHMGIFSLLSEKIVKILRKREKASQQGIDFSHSKAPLIHQKKGEEKISNIKHRRV